MEMFKKIKGFSRYVIGSEGTVLSKVNPLKPRILRTFINNSGYAVVDLVSDALQRKHCLVHRLVAESFLENPEGLSEINHKDENKLNNRLDNLEWCSRSYNNSFGTKIERFRKTYKEYCSVYGGPRQQACICLETGERFRSAREASEAFNICDSAIRKSCLYGSTVKGEFHFRYIKETH